MANTLDDILSLLAASIFADKRILSSELDAFVEAGQNLDAAAMRGADLSEAALRVWYEQHNPGIRAKMATPYFKDWFYELLARLSDLPGKRKILEAMLFISRADGQVHVSERALITLAAQYWQVEPV